jgi:hypothetical protein
MESANNHTVHGCEFDWIYQGKKEAGSRAA